MLELSRWFTGAPKLIIDADTIGVDAEEAYARARRELNIFYGRNATVGLMRIVDSGKAIDANDRAAHISLYANLRAAQATATTAGNHGKFDRVDILRKVINKKIPHLREKFWKRDEKARSRGEPKMTFTNLLEMLQFRAGILNEKIYLHQQHQKDLAPLPMPRGSKRAPHHTVDDTMRMRQFPHRRRMRNSGEARTRRKGEKAAGKEAMLPLPRSRA